MSSHEPAELRRTIEEREARLQAQDDIIEQQLRAIEGLEEKLERLQHQRYKCGSMAKLLNEPTMEIDALEEKAHELHNERMLLTSRWYLLQIASERRSMSATERIAEAERIRQRSPSAFPRA